MSELFALKHKTIGKMVQYIFDGDPTLANPLYAALAKGDEEVLHMLLAVGGTALDAVDSVWPHSLLFVVAWCCNSYHTALTALLLSPDIQSRS